MANPWLALETADNATQRARELRLARDQFLEDGGAPAGVRDPILDSWRRSAAQGLDPELRAAVLGASFTVPDGQPLVWALNLLGHRLSDRVYGPDLMDKAAVPVVTCRGPAHGPNEGACCKAGSSSS